MRISVSRSRAGALAFASSNRSSSSVHGPSFGRGWTSRSYENAVSPDRRIRRTVLRDRCRVREISLIDFPLHRCSRRIRPIVSTISIPHRPLRAKAGSRTNRKSGGQFWTPMTPLRGSILHAETHVIRGLDLYLRADLAQPAGRRGAWRAGWIRKAQVRHGGGRLRDRAQGGRDAAQHGDRSPRLKRRDRSPDDACPVAPYAHNCDVRRIECSDRASRTTASNTASQKLDKFDLLILDDLAYVTKDQSETSVLF